MRCIFFGLSAAIASESCPCPRCPAAVAVAKLLLLFFGIGGAHRNLAG